MTDRNPDDTAGVRIADEAPDVVALAGLMTDALLDTPVGQWLIPDRDIRLAVFGRYFRGLAGLLVVDPAAIIDRAADNTGFAVWFDMVNYALEPHPEHDDLLNNTCGHYADRFRLFETVTQYGLTRAGFQRCWLLAGVGVHPARRGTGVGSALLQHRLDDLDTEIGWPLWTLSVSPAHRALLERHRYTVKSVVPLPDSGPAVSVMYRPAPT
jgi:GNAT superfamily N-acetyltransferase